MSENSMKNIDYLEKLTETIKNNAFKDAEFSYTAKLIGDIEYLSKKIGEEASEVIIAALSKDKENLKKEAEKYLDIFKNHPYIFNLGHGVLPESDPNLMDYLVKTVKNY